MENILSRLIICWSIVVPFFLEGSESARLEFRRHEGGLANGFDVLTLPVIAAFLVLYQKCMLRQSITFRIQYLGEIFGLVFCCFGSVR